MDLPISQQPLIFERPFYMQNELEYPFFLKLPNNGNSPEHCQMKLLSPWEDPYSTCCQNPNLTATQPQPNLNLVWFLVYRIFNSSDIRFGGKI